MFRKWPTPFQTGTVSASERAIRGRPSRRAPGGAATFAAQAKVAAHTPRLLQGRGSRAGAHGCTGLAYKEGRGGGGDIKGSKCCDEKILILIAITTHLYAPYLEMS